jgi:membrane protease YdiL (CAAX protease family)
MTSESETPEPVSPLLIHDFNLPLNTEHGDGQPFAHGFLVGASWLVILLVTTALIFLTTYEQWNPEPTVSTKSDHLQLVMFGKTSVAQRIFGMTAENTAFNESILQQLEMFNAGSLEQRYGYALLLNEFAGAEEALAALNKIDGVVERLEYKPTESQSRLRGVIGLLLQRYANGNADSGEVPKSDRDFVVEQLDWIGQLALYPSGTPYPDRRIELLQSTAPFMAVLFGGGFFLILLVMAGLALAIVFAILLAIGGLRPAMPRQSSRGAIYAETFALWLLLFVAMQFVLGISLEMKILQPQQMLFGVILVFIGSLSVLFWPVLRGIPFSSVRQDIGWTWRNPLVEFSAAVVSYAALLPFLLLSIAVTILIMFIQSGVRQTHELAPLGPPGHPIQEEIASGNGQTWLLVFLTACIAAPIVEETMFRGVLFRHLRDLTSPARLGLSVMLAALGNALIFALIHPQGLMGVPPLVTLAVGFSLVRHWRDSLIAPIIMHALNNGILIGFLILLLSQ